MQALCDRWGLILSKNRPSTQNSAQQATAQTTTEPTTSIFDWVSLGYLLILTKPS